MNERLEGVSTQIIAEQEKLDNVYKSTDRFRPLIDRLLNALYTCCSIDVSKTYTAEEIKQFDIRMITYPDDYKWEMQFEDFQDFLDTEPYIAEDLMLSMKDEKIFIFHSYLFLLMPAGSEKGTFRLSHIKYERLENYFLFTHNFFKFFGMSFRPKCHKKLNQYCRLFANNMV